MRCAWNELLDILPPWLRGEVDRLGKKDLQELRLRINAPPELVLRKNDLWLTRNPQEEDLNFIVNTASRYSPWRATTAAQGYLTAPGGHRIGICGEAVCKEGIVTGIREIHSLCIRVARDFPGILTNLADIQGSVLIIGPPGWGKTTLLRDLIRQISKSETVAVVDERGELFPPGFAKGQKMDVLTGCPKNAGVEILLRTMGPSCIAVDEITAKGDCAALIQAANCGVRLLATAHAGSRKDFISRSVYRPLIEENVIHTLLILRRDKSYITERMAL